MANKSDTITKVTLKEVLAEIDARIAHIEDATLDNRDVLVKLVKQSNQIVKFLQQLEVEEVLDEGAVDISFTPGDISLKEDMKSKAIPIKELIEEFMEKHEELKDFEKELKKVKLLLTPGQIGEA